MRASWHKRAKRWYNSRRWQALRNRQLEKHPFCQCSECDGKWQEAQVVDHIAPHMGDAKLFWDPTNLQSLTIRCHNSRKQSEEWQQTRKEYLERLRATKGCDADGMPKDPSHPWNS